MQTSSEFQATEKVLASLFETNQLEQKSLQKLLVLQALLRSYPIEAGLMSEQDMESLVKLPRQQQERIFIEMVRESAIRCRFSIPQSSELVEGEIDVKSKNFGSWKPKLFQFNFKKGTFEILRSKRSKKKPRTINLGSYRLQIVEAKSSRKQFRLSCIDQRDGYYKKLNCGSLDHVFCDKLIEGLKLISNWDPEPISKNKKGKKQSVKLKPQQQMGLIQQEELDLKHNFRIYQSMVFSKGLIGNNEVPIGRQSLNYNPRPADFQIENNTFSNSKTLQQPTGRWSVNINSSDQMKVDSLKEIKPASDFQQSNQQPVQIVDEKINQEAVKFEQASSPVVIQQQVADVPITVEEQKLKSPEEEIKQQQEDSKQESSPQLKVENEDVVIQEKSPDGKQQSEGVLQSSPVSQSSPNRGQPDQPQRIESVESQQVEFSQDSQNLEDIQPRIQAKLEEEDEFLSVEDPAEKQDHFDEQVEVALPRIFTKLDEEQKLSPEYFSRTCKNFIQVYSKESLSIFKSTTNSLLFRCYLDLRKWVTVDQLFQALAEIEFVKKWNGSLNCEQSRIVSLIQSEKSAIIYERRKQYGVFYLPRDFVYLRHVTRINNCIYILDKSIEHEEVPPIFRVVRGEINYSLIQVLEDIECFRVIWETECTNGGFSSAEQDGEITQIYLQELANITKFLELFGPSRQIDSPFLQALKDTKSSSHQIKLSPMNQVERGQEEVKSTQMQASIQPIREFGDSSDQNQIERFRQINLEQQAEIQKKLLDIQSTGTFQELEPARDNGDPVDLRSPGDQQRLEEEDEEEEEEEEVEEEDKALEQEVIEKVVTKEVVVEKEQLPEDVVLSTRSQLTQEDRMKVIRQITKIEQSLHHQYCLGYRFQMGPTEVKNAEHITENEGGHFFLRKDWERDKRNGGLRFVNTTKIEAQKRVIKYLLKKIGANLVTGRSVLCISLPVEIFETRSNLERTAYSFTYAPLYLERAAKEPDPVKQLQLTMTFGLTSIIMYLSLEKPFNPILGETYQGFIHGCPVFVEQICHHPPTCAFQMVGRGYTIDGHIETFAQLHANSFTGKNVGYLRVNYENTKARQMFISVPGTLYGTAFGDRVFKLEGKQFGIDLENELFTDLNFNPGKSSSFFSKKTETPCDYFTGGIYKVKPQAVTRYRKEGYAKWTGLDLEKDVVRKYNTISGIWNEFMEVDGEKTWTLSMYPYHLTNHPNPLPSDSNYRIDLLYWKLKDFNNSQRVKEAMEVHQRRDKKLRETAYKKKH